MTKATNTNIDLDQLMGASVKTVRDKRKTHAPKRTRAQIQAGADIFADEDPNDSPIYIPGNPEPGKETRETIGISDSFDPSQPLPDNREEKYCQELLKSGLKYLAFKRAFHSKASKKNCSGGACRVEKSPEVLARISYLRGSDKEDLEFQGILTREQKLWILQRVMRTGNPADRIRALTEHNKLTGDVGPEADNPEKKVPDPVFLMEYFRQCERQGRDPLDVATPAAAPDIDTPISCGIGENAEDITGLDAVQLVTSR